MLKNYGSVEFKPIIFEGKLEPCAVNPFLWSTLSTSEMSIEGLPANVFIRFINLCLKLFGYEIYLTVGFDNVKIEDIDKKDVGKEGIECEITGKGKLKNKSYKLRRRNDKR